MSVYKRYCIEKFDESGRLLSMDFDYPENFNFGYDVVDATAAEEPNKRALVWCNAAGEERTFSFGEISRLSSRVANVLRAAGIGRGDYVMVALKRHYEYWIVSVALHKLGAVMIPMTHMLTAHDIEYRMSCRSISGIICTPDDDLHDRMLEAAANKAPNCRFWTVQRSVPGFRNLTEEMESASETFERVETRASDPMLLYFTSGTTGYPKGVIHDFTYPLAHVVTAKYWQQAEENGLHFTVAETGWAKASWGKIYGQWLVGSAVMVYDFDNFEPKQLVSVINKYGVTSFCAPATVYRYLARKGIPAMPNLKHAATAGEQLNPSISKTFTESTGLPLAEGYGQTETTILLGNFCWEEPVVGSLGKPSPIYDIEIRDADGTLTPEGEVGEIVILPKNGKRPTGLCCGYLDEETYAAAWDGGVYHTGDSALKDKDGRFYFYGRIDDIIKSGGFRIGPNEVENVLMAHPGVMECAVVGVPDPLRGQAIKAFVVPSPGYTASPEFARELREYANSRMAEYKWIRFVEFMDEIPKTISGKMRKTELRK